MIATVRFFTEGVQEGMLVNDVWFSVMHERTREILVLAGAQTELVKFVSGVRCRSEEGTEEAHWFWGGQSRQWECWRVSWFAFIPERGWCL